MHDTLKKARLLLCRVPKELLARNPNSVQHMYGQARTRMALVWHEKTLPRENEERQQQMDQQQRQQRQQQRQRIAEERRERIAQRQRRYGMFCDSDEYDSCDYGSEDDDLYGDYGYGDEDIDSYVDRVMASRYGRPGGYRQPPEGVRFGLPQLVVIPELHVYGGDAADKAVRKVGAVPAGCAVCSFHCSSLLLLLLLLLVVSVSFGPVHSESCLLHTSRLARALHATTASLLCFKMPLPNGNRLVLAAAARCILLPACRASLRS
jgi:hypothetical protein